MEPELGKTRVDNQHWVTSEASSLRFNFLVFSHMEINFIEIYEMALNSNQGNGGNQFIDSYNNSDVGDFFNYGYKHTWKLRK